MICPLMLLVLAPSAPVPKTPPTVEVVAKRYAYPPQLVIGLNGMPQLFNVDDGHFVEVTVKNVSADIMSISYRRKLVECVDVKVTDAKGTVVSERGRHIGFRRATDGKKLDLLPGESFTVIVHLEQDWPEEPEHRNPGKYKARIVFESGRVRTESTATFEVDILK